MNSTITRNVAEAESALGMPRVRGSERRLSHRMRDVFYARAPWSPARILVPMDFSPAARKAMRYAVPLARYAGSRIILLNVIEHKSRVHRDFRPDRTNGSKRLAPLDERERELLALADKEIGREIKSEAIVQMGKAWREIINTARTYYVDLIIIGTSGHRSVHRLVANSTAERVARLSPCPVLVIHEDEHDFVQVN